MLGVGGAAAQRGQRAACKRDKGERG